MESTTIAKRGTLLAGLMALVLALGTFICLQMPSTALAETDASDSAVSSNGTTFNRSFEKGDVLPLFATNMKITNIKSSKPSVATAKMKKYGDNKCLTVAYKKSGKTKIFYLANGKKCSFTLKLYKYKNPLKTFKIGSKSYKSKFNKARAMYKTKNLLSGKVKLKAAKGWKIEYAYAYGKYGDEETKAVKNGTKLPGKKTGNVTIVLKNKKTGVEEVVAVFSTSKKLVKSLRS